MRFLLSNDDGVFAPGLMAMAEVLATLGEVTVVAPDIERSAFSSALTLDRPLRPQRLANGFIAVNGTPADCVHIALNGLLDFVPDVIVSGINSGANLGDDVIYSGTVAAALEGRFLGRPALAVSLVASHAKTLDISAYKAAAEYAGELLQRWRELDLPPRCVLNVNVPAGEKSLHKGFMATRLGHRAAGSPVLKLQDPRGQDMFWIGPPGKPMDDADGTAFHAIAQRWVSVTALDSDMTCHRADAALKHWLPSSGS